MNLDGWSFGSGGQRSYQVEIVVHLMSKSSGRRDGGCEHPSASIRRIPDSLWDASKKHHQRRLEGIRKKQRHIEAMLTNVTRDASPVSDAGWFRFAPYFIDERRRREKPGHPRPHQKGEFDALKVFAQRLYCWNREDGIADPVRPTDEDSLNIHQSFGNRLIMSAISRSNSGILAEIRR